MAEGYLKIFKNKATIYSAGVKNHEINQKAVFIMKKDNINISNHTSNHILEYQNLTFDFIITVCDHANETCPNFYSKKAVRIHHDFFDPSNSEFEDNWEESFKKSRDEIKLYCMDFKKKYFS
jgi:arsenate reductase